jgi:branched-chain amino acid transport system substrate-binding protein
MEYNKSYKNKYGIESIAPDRSGYDALLIVANALERAGTITDGQKIRDALAKTDFDGIRQRYSFAENGQAKIEMWIVKLEKKKVIYLKQIPVYENPVAPL